MTQKQFEAQLLVGCHLYSEERGTPEVSAREVVKRFLLKPEAGWVSASVDSFVANELARHAADLSGELETGIRLTNRGHQIAEDWLDSGAVRFEPDTDDD